MSVKSQFLKKLRARPPSPVPAMSKSQADIAEFRLRMTQLQEQMDVWLVDTGLNVEMFTVPVTDLLVEGGFFDISAIVLRCEDRSITFTPVFLYGQGVTGCVETALHAGGVVTPQGRLFMRAGHVRDWTFSLPGGSSRPGEHFDEGTFFCLILAILP